MDLNAKGYEWVRMQGDMSQCKGIRMGLNAREYEWVSMQRDMNGSQCKGICQYKGI